MQIASKTTPHKQPSLERQAQGNGEISSKTNSSSDVKTIGNDNLPKGAEKNETSQYLKVLSRIENLIAQKKLPDAAIDGFIGAIRNQIELIGEVERNMLLKLPEAEEIELKNIDQLPEIIKENIRNKEELPSLFKFLKLPKFAELMQEESANVSKTYSAQSKNNVPIKKTSEISVLDIPKSNQKENIAELSNSIMSSNGKKI